MAGLLTLISLSHVLQIMGDLKVGKVQAWVYWQVILASCGRLSLVSMTTHCSPLAAASQHIAWYACCNTQFGEGLSTLLIVPGVHAQILV